MLDNTFLADSQNHIYSLLYTLAKKGDDSNIAYNIILYDNVRFLQQQQPKKKAFDYIKHT